MRTVRAEVTDRMLIAGPRHLRAVLAEYVTHYNQHRPHRAMDLRPPDGGDTSVADLATTRIRRRKVLGCLIHEYQRAGMTISGRPRSRRSKAMTRLWSPICR